MFVHISFCPAVTQMQPVRIRTNIITSLRFLFMWEWVGGGGENADRTV